MKLRALLLITVGAASFATSSFAADQSADEAQIRAHYDAIVKGNQHLDATMSMEGYAKDVQVFDIAPPMEVDGYVANKKSYETFFSALSGPVVGEFTHMKITMLGPDHALVTSYYQQSFPMKNGQKVSLKCRVTDVFAKQQGKWMVIHEHNSAPIDMQTGKADFNAADSGAGQPFAQH